MTGQLFEILEKDWICYLINEKDQTYKLKG